MSFTSANSFSSVGGDGICIEEISVLSVVKDGHTFLIPLLEGMSLTDLGQILIAIDSGDIPPSNGGFTLVNWNS